MNLLPLWAGVALAVTLVEIVRAHSILINGKRPLNRKPFNCAPCLSFWLTAVFYAFAIYVREAGPILQAVAIICSGSLAACLLSKLIRL
jgi:hypothetical protein